MKAKIIVGIIAMLLLVATIIYFSSTFSTIDSQDISCEIVLDSCDGYENCQMIDYNSNRVACIGSDQIASEDAVSDNSVLTNTYIVDGPEIEGDE